MSPDEEDKPRKMAIVVSEGSFDKAMMPMILATTGATMGMEVHIFFTFFGLNLLKKDANPKLSGFYRLFTGMFKKRMKKVGVDDFQAQRELAIEMGANLYACSTTMRMMDLSESQMVDGIKVLGAAAFLDIAADSEIQLFIG
jgi:peroxiredoxin family protein